MRPGRFTATLAVAFTLIGGSLFGISASTGVTGAAGATVAIHPTVRDHLASRSGPVTTAQCEALFNVACYEPSQIQTAYDEGPLFSNGVTGAGQAIAVVDPFGSPTIAADLHTFDQAFGLPDPPALTIVQPSGRVPAFDSHNTDMVAWASETTLDVEWAHVIAPGASIVLAETPVAETEGSAGFKQIVKADQFIVDHRLANVISQSFSATEQTFPRGLHELTPLRRAFIKAADKKVTVLAASGDEGTAEPLNSSGSDLSTAPVTTWPASDPLVTGVGGTQLHLDPSGARSAPDSVWNDGGNLHLDQEFFGNPGPDAVAAGGGLSALFKRPPYQNSVRGVVGSARGVPDISMSAACDGAVDVYESFPGIGPGWYLSCGTSEATPLFAGIVALADQSAGHGLGVINPALYAMSSDGAAGISDVTTGNNTVSFHQGGHLVTVPGFAAATGYDLASGLGTVDAANFVPELVAASTGDHVKGRQGGGGILVPGGASSTRDAADPHAPAHPTTTQAHPPAQGAAHPTAGTLPARPAASPAAGPASSSRSAPVAAASPARVLVVAAPAGGAPNGFVGAPPAVANQSLKEDGPEMEDSPDSGS